LVSSTLTIVLFVILRFTASDYPFGIFKFDLVLFVTMTNNTMVKFDDNKGVIRRARLRRTDNTLVKFDDTKGVIRSRKSKKDRQHNGQI
jgi:hypothetical protein